MTSQEAAVLDLIDKISGAPKYQTVELDGQVMRAGTEKCHLTWDNILKLNVDFKDKVIYDLGCFNGYFSFKARGLGAKQITGVDQNHSAVRIYNFIADTYGYDNCRCKLANLLECDFFTGKSDITLVLNVMHHVKRLDLDRYMITLAYIFDNSNMVIAEVNDAELVDFDSQAAKSKLKLTNKIKSHRLTQFGQRYVLLYQS